MWKNRYSIFLFGSIYWLAYLITKNDVREKDLKLSSFLRLEEEVKVLRQLKLLLPKKLCISRVLFVSVKRPLISQLFLYYNFHLSNFSFFGFFPSSNEAHKSCLKFLPLLDRLSIYNKFSFDDLASAVTVTASHFQNINDAYQKIARITYVDVSGDKAT